MTINTLHASVTRRQFMVGAAGLTCALAELSSRGGCGAEVDLERVPVREEGMSAYELLLSESQERIAKLEAQVASAVKVIAAYSKEYDLGQRSLIDLLNAENQSFNAQVSLISARSVVIFADYQLLAAVGKLLAYVRAPHPVDAEPLVATGGFGLVPVKLGLGMREPVTTIASPSSAGAAPGAGAGWSACG